jgi:hypothetical protein
VSSMPESRVRHSTTAGAGSQSTVGLSPTKSSDIFRLTPFQSPPGRYGLCTLEVLTRPAGPIGSAASSPMMTAEKVEKKKSREPISCGNRRESESYSSRGITSAGLA